MAGSVAPSMEAGDHLFAGLDLAGITRQVLGDIDAALRDGSWRDVRTTMPFYRMQHGRAVRDMI